MKLRMPEKMNKTGAGRFLGAYGSLILVIVLLMIITMIFNPVFLTSSNIVQLLINNNTVFLAGLGMTFVIISGGIDLSQGAIAAFSTMITAYLILKGLPALAVAALVLLAGTLIGCLNGAITALGHVHSFVVTLGMTTILRGLSVALYEGYPIPIKMENGLLKIGNGSVLGVSNVIWICALLFVICYIVLKKTDAGRNIFAVGGNPEAAKFSGINVVKTTIFSFGVSGILTAAAGLIMAARMYSGVPSAAQGLETSAITTVIIGGTSFTGGDGSVAGTFFGTILLAILVNGMVLFGFTDWLQNVVSGIIIIVSVIYDQRRHKM